jgi:hypothetical protein
VFDTPGEDLWEAFRNAADTLYEALVSSLLSTTEIVFGVAPDFATQEILSTPYLTGAATGDPMPAFTAGILSRRTALLTRRGRGRLYLPPSAESFNSQGIPSGSYTNGLQALGDALVPTIGDGITTSVWTPMLWSESDQVAREITSFQARSIWGVQRDRRRLYEA